MDSERRANYGDGPTNQYWLNGDLIMLIVYYDFWWPNGTLVRFFLPLRLTTYIILYSSNIAEPVNVLECANFCTVWNS